MVSCTLITNRDGHVSVMPATPICALAQCENQFSDRAERAGNDNEDSATTDAEMSEESELSTGL